MSKLSNLEKQQLVKTKKKTLHIFLDFIKGSFKDLETILESSELLEDHFISK